MHFLLKLFRAGLDTLLDLIQYHIDIVLSIGLVLEETSCVSYPGYVVLFQLIMVWGLSTLNCTLYVC